MSWILSPFLQLAITAAGLIGCLALFLGLKRENAELRARLLRQQEDIEGRVDSFQRSLLQMKESIDEQETAPLPDAPAPVVHVPGASINLNKRSQALRMYRRGEPAERIAAALQMSRNEVELILKVHRTVVEQV